MMLIVVAGPTAVGKTRVAIALAERLGTEIVSADARQVYREMRIGTAHPSEQELARVRHHLVGTHSIHESYNAAAYGAEALAIITDLFKRYEYVILCGGSGLYIKAVLEGFDDIPDVDPAVRENLNREYREKGLPWLQEKMRELDPEYYAVMDKIRSGYSEHWRFALAPAGRSPAFENSDSVRPPFRLSKSVSRWTVRTCIVLLTNALIAWSRQGYLKKQRRFTRTVTLMRCVQSDTRKYLIISKSGMTRQKL
jgi:hypothetical protein